jgi:hypothetical protein
MDLPGHLVRGGRQAQSILRLARGFHAALELPAARVALRIGDRCWRKRLIFKR